jgi:hypothetical protein
VEVKNLYNSPQTPAREVRSAGLRVAYRDTTPVEACVGVALGHGDEHFALTVDKAFQWVVPGGGARHRRRRSAGQGTIVLHVKRK